MRRPSEFHAHLRFDVLEAREVPSTASLSGGVLSITHHTITLRNPWGANDSKPVEVTPSMSSVESNFDSWYAADI